MPSGSTPFAVDLKHNQVSFLRETSKGEDLLKMIFESGEENWILQYGVVYPVDATRPKSKALTLYTPSKVRTC